MLKHYKCYLLQKIFGINYNLHYVGRHNTTYLLDIIFIIIIVWFCVAYLNIFIINLINKIQYVLKN